MDISENAYHLNVVLIPLNLWKFIQRVREADVPVVVRMADECQKGFYVRIADIRLQYP